MGCSGEMREPGGSVGDMLNTAFRCLSVEKLAARQLDICLEPRLVFGC